MKARLILLMYVFALTLFIVSKKNEEISVVMTTPTFSADYRITVNGESFMKKRILNNMGKTISLKCFHKDSATGEWQKVEKVLENEEYFIADLKQ
jgi:hypothetical protein